MKKVICLSILATFFCVLFSSGQFKNDTIYLFSYFKNNGEDGLHLAYSEDGFHWKALHKDSSVLKPAVGNEKLMRDPCIIRGGDKKFHMVWTASWKDKGIGYASSSDLVHWSEQEFLPVMKQEEGSRNCWAPEITYDTKKRNYMIYWSTTITGKFTETASEKESGYNHRIYYTTTPDFKSYSPTKLLYDPGFNVIDATIVKDSDRYLMFMKDETREPPQKNLKIASGKNLAGPYSAAGKPITSDYWAEGPTLLKKGSQWIIYFDKYTLHRYGAISSGDLENWKDISDEIDLPKGIRHGTILEITKAELSILQKSFDSN
ncbi:family 43 glycosylhydrolase [Pedobacter sp. HMF7647]|uniref:Family 43 glycosylhydrolase n=1 Tax=Hufsiella arboris TaxID=2695275 RepID=A0A7K1YCI8_9SPHI|nr:glycoside hydrolase family 43 protein [Hufsiella arboris]MXV52285.1 family 43 glycosylhydrolase [Hufsiella arboris]